MTEETAPRADPDETPVDLSWEIDVRLVTHPLMLAYLARVLLLSGTIMGGLLALLFAVTGHLDGIVPMLELTALAVVAVALLTLLVSFAIFGNRLAMRFTLDRMGAAATVIDPRAGRSNKAAIVLGLLTGRPGVVGAGLTAQADASRRVAWTSVAHAHCHKHLCAVTLSNSWRGVMTLFCTAQNYEAVAAAVRAARAVNPTKPHANPLPLLLLHSGLIVLACLPLFKLPLLGSDGVLPALIALCFALASLWLSPVLAWSMPVWLGWLIVLEFAACFETRKSIFGGTYTAYQVLNDGDRIALALAIAGLTYLAWLCLGLVTGRIRSGLAGDLVE